MLVKFTPEKLDTDEKGPGELVLKDVFTGFIELSMPSYAERLRIPKEIGIEKIAGSKLGTEEDGSPAPEKLKNSLEYMEILALCSEKVKPFIKGVEITYVPDGTKLESADDLYTFPAAGALVSALCTKFIMGFLEKKV